jgi:hypothetical protein
MTPTPKDIESFRLAYGVVHFACQQLEEMTDEHGNLNPTVTIEQVELLKRTCREAACAANGMMATEGGVRL